MKEQAKSVERLLSAIYRNADERTVQILAHYLNYDVRQLKEDIEEIPKVLEIVSKLKRYGTDEKPA